MSGTRIHDVAETSAFAERRLRDGTPLTYKLTVLQQPMIARACGMGAKSHADRRPVDPPPVVELKIFSGDRDEKSDITFSHNSNFFLFATLEQARPIAQGRGMPAPAPQPVLTGVPVSGMAYLDRPTPGGYFIFPDLSVRHEGKYRLRFALYEETKDRDELATSAQEGGPTEFAAFRVEVKSKPFTVYSAKKFPGLKESTALSRIVAEQGCRVRIRRDVRMRRRSDRHGGRDGDMDMDETAMIRARGRQETPEYEDDMRGQGHHQPAQHPHPHHQPPPHHAPIHPMQRSNSVGRKRSDSDASSASMPDGPPPPPPRFDERYTPRPEHNAYGPPPPAALHHLAFGSGSHPAPPSVHPPQVYGHNPMPRYQAGPAPVPQPQHQAPHVASRPQPMPTAQYTPGPPPYHREPPINGHMQHGRRGSASQEYHAPPPPPSDHVRRESDTGYRVAHAPQHYRPSTPSIGQPNGHYHAHIEAPYVPPQVQQYQPPPPPPPQYQSQASLPPLKLPPLAMEPLPWSRSSVSSPSTNGPQAAALPSPAAYGPPASSMPQQHQPHPQSQYHAYPTQPQPPYIPAAAPPPVAPAPEPVNGQTEEGRGTKRQWGRVFNNAHVTEPLHNGRRPDTTSTETAYGQEPPSNCDDDDEFDIGKLKMRYRRADGEEIVRRLPLDE